MDDCESFTYVTIGKNKEEVEQRERAKLEEEISCFMGLTVTEISVVEGYKIHLTKI